MSERPSRWLGLDALRGLSIASMILVNNPGRWGASTQYSQLRHAAWHGCTFTDLVFPTFLFCCGVAIVPALSRKLDSGAPRGALVGSLLKRVALLILIGVLLGSFPWITFDESRSLFAPLLEARWPGVLQRIGICYGMAALLFVYASVRVQRLVMWGCLLLYWPLLMLGSENIDDAASTIVSAVDRALLGDHIWVKGVHDPEGLLSTIGALPTCMLGVEAGRWLRDHPEPGPRVAGLAARGLLLLGLGACWGLVLPWNKALWTSSYTVWTAGIAMLTLAACCQAFENGRFRRLGRGLQIYGVNALLVFVGSGLVGRVIGSLWTVSVADGAQISAREWFFRNALLPWLELKPASLGFALLWIATWFAALFALSRRGIVWKV